MTTMTLPGRLMRPVATPPARRATLIGFAATLLAGLIIIVGISVGIGLASAGTVLPGVSTAGVDLSGLSREAAVARLSAELPSLSAGTATIAVDGEETTVGYGDLGRRYDTGAMVDAAFGVGRAGDPVTDALDRLRNLVHPVTLPVTVHAYDEDALARISSETADQFTVAAVDAAVTSEGTTYTVTPSKDGMALDESAVSTALARALDGTDPADVRIELTSTAVGPDITTAAAEELAESARATVEPLALEIPNATESDEALSFAPETIASWLSIGPGDAEPLALLIDEAAAAAAVEGLVEAVEQKPVNAQIGVAPGSGLGGVVPGQDGRALDVEATTEALLAALEQRGSGGPVPALALAVNVTEPALSTAEAEAALPKMEMISTWTTHYVPGESNGFGNNINIPARDIDGRNLAPGETFSFWGSLGPITVERGYTYGGAIIGGRTTQGVALAGGICSTSTTIFNAALRAGLEMGDRANHSYYIDRYPDGLDATVLITDGYTQDMTFRNDTDNPIVVRGFGGDGFVTFELWSIPTGRRVVISDPVTSNHSKAIDTTQIDSSLAPGTAKRVEFPHDGHDVSRTRVVYDAAGNEIHRNTYFSSYDTVNGITLIGA